MPKKILTYFLLVIFPGFSEAQEIYQTVRGTVVSETGVPLQGAAVAILNVNQTGTLTDSSGTFRMTRVPVGRYTLKVSQLGYNELILPGVLVEAGKEVVLELQMQKGKYDLQEVEISSPTYSSEEQLNTRSFTVEETKRFAANFNDPARLASSFPGVINDNDQANNIVIRGNSPNGLLWRLEGVDIVNPNHLDNAGTFSDRAAAKGGGVNILSAQLLDRSELVTGSFGAEYGNVLSGAFNMKLRKGNNEHMEYTAQASLLGMDVAAEGPLSKNKKSSYLINYRYSTIGLLSLMNINFGDEKTNFQDLSFHLFFPTEKAGVFTVFGIGGLSSNAYKAKRDSSLWESSKERYDINFTSGMGAIGFTHAYPVNYKLSFKTTLAVSDKQVERKADLLDQNYNLRRVEEDDMSETKISLHSYLNYSLNRSHTIVAGVNSNQLFYDVFSLDGSEIKAAQVKVKSVANYQLFQSYVILKSYLTERLVLSSGLHYMHLSLNKDQSIEPRFSLTYNFKVKGAISLAYGIQSQVQQPNVYFTSFLQADGSYAYPNKGLGFTKAHHYSAVYNYHLFKDLRLKIGSYYQYLYNVPVSAFKRDTYSIINSFETFTSDTLVNEGTGKNYGLELAVEKLLSNRYYFLFSSAFYKSLYTGSDGIERETRYNGNYAFCLSGGKEVIRSRNRMLGINIRAVYRGGYKEMPINNVASAYTTETTYMQEQAFSFKQRDYFRIDLRLSWKKEKQRYTRTLALDIQNVTNQKNVAYHYFDTLQKETVTKYQLGIIPVLSYRVEFGTRKK